MMRYLYTTATSLLWLVSAAPAVAEQAAATTGDGRAVMLYSNGSWHYAPDTDMEDGIDRGGAHYRNFDLPWPDPGLCAEACYGEEQCEAWTFVKTGYQGNVSRCWLKRDAPEGKDNPCCISGTRHAAADDSDEGRFSSAAGVSISESGGQSMGDLLASRGHPDNFSMMLVLNDEQPGAAPVAIEVWDYNEGKQAYVFFDGQPRGVAELPADKAASCPRAQHDPRMLRLGMNIAEAGTLLGTNLNGKELDDTSLDGYEIIAVQGLVLGFDDGRLVYADTCVLPTSIEER